MKRLKRSTSNPAALTLMARLVVADTAKKYYPSWTRLVAYSLWIEIWRLWKQASKFKTRDFIISHRHFSEINQLAKENNLTHVDGILLDFGISSPQIDEGVRGFSFRFDGPLDMRMDQTRGKTVAELLSTISEQQLGEVIKHYGEERFAKQVARAIIKERNDGRAITTTGQLAAIVASAIPKIEPGQNPATRTFQALRIFVNQELEELSLILPNV